MAGLERHIVPDRTELVARAAALQPLLREHAARSEFDRRATDEVVTALTDAGLYRLLTPAQFGGYEADLGTVLEVVETLGRADGSTAWLIATGSVATWMTGRGSQQILKEIFEQDPDARISGSGMAVPAQRVDGGVRLSGRWSYASGSPHAAWATCTALLAEDSGRPADVAMCLVPADEARLEDTWRTVGMRGTGSHTWVIEDVFVPEHRMFSMSAFADGSLPLPRDLPMYRHPLAPLASLPLVGPGLGLVDSALTLALEQAPLKSMHHTFFPRQSDSTGVQIQIAEAALKLKTARLHAYHIADELDSAAAADNAVEYVARAEMRAEVGLISRQLLESLQLLVDVHGAGSFAEGNRMQQYWRDANVAFRHAGLNAAVGYEIYGKALLGVPDRISPMV